MKADFTVEDIELEANFKLETGQIKSHDSLAGRTAPNQHPISAISGLEEALTTLRNDRDDLGDQVQEHQVDINKLKEDVTTLQGNDHDLGNQVQEIQVDVNALKTANVAHLTGEETLSDKTLDNPTIKNGFTVKGDEQIGETFDISFLNGTAQVATNNGLDFLCDANFLTNPSVETDSAYSSIQPGDLVTKKQVAQALSDVAGTHLEKIVLMGVPEAIELTENLQKMTMAATKVLPTALPDDIRINETGDGIIFMKEGLVHIKRNVSLGGANTENLYYEARVNDTRLEPLQAQAVSVSKNTMNFSIEFYWWVTARQEISIWANCVSNTCNLNYKGVTTVVEYL